MTSEPGSFARRNIVERKPQIIAQVIEDNGYPPDIVQALEAFADEIEKYSLIITYAGSSFDLPRIRRAFPGLRLDQFHIDLCPTLRRIGLKGGLKCVEKTVGLTRPSEIDGMNGWDAVRLWREYEWGSREALDLLIAYNAHDVINLLPLARRAYDSLRSLVFGF